MQPNKSKSMIMRNSGILAAGLSSTDNESMQTHTTRKLPTLKVNKLSNINIVTLQKKRTVNVDVPQLCEVEVHGDWLKGTHSHSFGF